MSSFTEQAELAKKLYFEKLAKEEKTGYLSLEQITKQICEHVENRILQNIQNGYVVKHSGFTGTVFNKPVEVYDTFAPPGASLYLQVQVFHQLYSSGGKRSLGLFCGGPYFHAGGPGSHGKRSEQASGGKDPSQGKGRLFSKAEQLQELRESGAEVSL